MLKHNNTETKKLVYNGTEIKNLYYNGTRIRLKQITTGKYKMSDLYPSDYQTRTSVPQQVFCGTTAESMFDMCEKLTAIDTSEIDVSEATNMHAMFNHCKAVTSIDVSKFDTSKCTDMHELFRRMYAVKALDVSHFDTSKVTNMESMFSECRELTTVDLRSFDTSKVTDFRWMFNGDKNLTKILGIFDFSSITSTDMVKDMFAGCSSLKAIYAKNISSTMKSYIEQNFKIKIYKEGETLRFKEAYPNYETMTSVPSDYIYNGTDFTNFFEGCKNLVSVDLKRMGVTKITNATNMFNDCEKLVSVDLSGVDASSVSHAAYMFYDCINLKSVNLGNLGSTKIGLTTAMFYNCRSLTSIDVSMLKPSTNIAGKIFIGDPEIVIENPWEDGCNSMFMDCHNLRDIKMFDTSGVTSFTGMFDSCESLTSLGDFVFDMKSLRNSRETMREFMFDEGGYPNKSYPLVRFMFYCTGLARNRATIKIKSNTISEYTKNQIRDYNSGYYSTSFGMSGNEEGRNLRVNIQFV